MSDQLLRSVLARYSPTPAELIRAGLTAEDLKRQLVGYSRYVIDVRTSGSVAKQTNIRGGSDLDLFISLSSACPETLRSIYEDLLLRARHLDPQARQQNVSIGLTFQGLKVDLVPGRRQTQWGGDHSLFVRRTGNWTKTNVDRHVAFVSSANLSDEIRLVKIWCSAKRLPLTSFLAELVTIEALGGHRRGALAANFVRSLEFFREELARRRFVDPANTNNCVSDELSAAEKATIVRTAALTLAGSWQSAFV